MTFEYAILPEKRCIAVRCSGTLTISDVIAVTRTLWADPLYDKTYNGIANLSQVVPGGTAEQLGELLGFFKHPSTTTGRWGVIISNPKFTALTLLFKSLSHSRPWIEVFTSWENACTFLGMEIPESVFDGEAEAI